MTVSVPRDSGRGRELLAPLPLAAIAVMVVNDRWLKPAFGGPIPGKLSDLAICFFLPLYVSALLELVTRWSLRARLFAGSLATAAVFVPIKTSEPALALFLATLTAVGRHVGLPHMAAMVDPTDLVALPMIPLAVLLCLHRARDEGRDAAPTSRPRDEASVLSPSA